MPADRPPTRPIPEAAGDGAPSAPHGTWDGEPAAIEVALTGEPDSLPPTWYKKCEAEVQPEGKGRCPRCQTFLRQNFVARKHPVNRLRRQQLLDKFVRDYRPDTQRLRSMCEQYAGVVEQLEVIKPGSPEHQRLVQLSQTLGAALEETRSRSASPDLDATDGTTDQLIERTTALLHHLLELHDAEHRPIEPGSRESAQRDALYLDPALAPVPSESGLPEPICEYCHRACVGPSHFAYAVLHWADPEEVAKRDADATQVMRRMVGGPLPDWYRS